MLITAPKHQKRYAPVLARARVRPSPILFFQYPFP
jgi:hypothetical protein